MKKIVNNFLLLFLVSMLVACDESKTQKDGQEEVIVCSYGGSFQEAQRKAFFEPFEKETGVKVIEDNWSGEYAKIKAMVDAKNVKWDLVTAAEGSAVARGAKEGILEKIDYTNINKGDFLDGALFDHSVGFDYFSTALAYRSDVYKENEGPKSWTDFWDLKKFPGKRALRKDPRTTLEFALLADGVSINSLYPIDVPRALKSLDKIKNSIVWWTAGSQPVELLANKEVVMTSAFNGRIWTAAKNDKLPFLVEYNEGCLDLDTWIIPKGAKNYKNAMKLIEYTCRPEVQNRLIEYINYSPTAKKSYSTLSPDIMKILPTSEENIAKQFLFDSYWWANNEARILDQWNAWLLK